MPVTLTSVTVSITGRKQMTNDYGVELQRHQTDSSYSRLQHADDLELEEFENFAFPSCPDRNKLRCRVKILLWVLFGLAVLAVMGVWGFPWLIDKVVIPLMKWEAATFSRPVLALVLVASLAFCPILLIPSGPSMWLAGMIYGYGYGFLIIATGSFIGMSLPFFISRWLFQARIQKWLQKWPRRAALIRTADQGSWFEQFRLVLILRVSPIPYPLFNYAVATTKVKYEPYICSSFAILIPEAFVTIYSGRLLKTLANMKTSRQHMTPFQIVYNVIGLCMAVGVTIVIMVYGRKAMRELELKDEIEKHEMNEHHCRGSDMASPKGFHIVG